MSSRVLFETLRSKASSALTGGYDALGAALAHPSIILKIVNSGSTAVTVSTDASTDIDIVPAGTFVLYDMSKERQGNIAFPANTRFYIKGTAGTGTIYLTSIYLSERT